MTVDELVTVEQASIRAFVESCAEHFTGRVLDYGCGRQPYRDVVEAAGAEYVPWDRKAYPGGSVADYGDRSIGEFVYDAIICTQVIEYENDPAWMLDELRSALVSEGVLVLTGPTCWLEPPGHLHNFTLEGIRWLLESAGFGVERLESRGHVGPGLSIGYGAVARA